MGCINYEAKLSNGGILLKLVESIASYTGESYTRIKQVLNDDVKNIIAKAARDQGYILQIESKLLNELIDMDVFTYANGAVRANTAIFFEEDIQMLYTPVFNMGSDIANIVKHTGYEIAHCSPNVRNFIGSIMGMGQGLHAALKEMKLASNWQNKIGRYEKSKVDFNQQCGAYNKFGEDLQIKRIHRGRHFTSVVIGPGNNDYFSYLWNNTSTIPGEKNKEFFGSIITYLTDVFPLLISGQISDESLKVAAEAAHIDTSDTSSVITVEDAKRYQPIIQNISEACTQYILDHIELIHELLSSTTVGQQGVPTENMMMNFWRYLRRTVAINLYKNSFLEDNVKTNGTITVFYDNAIDYFG